MAAQKKDVRAAAQKIQELMHGARALYDKEQYTSAKKLLVELNTCAEFSLSRDIDREYHDQSGKRREDTEGNIVKDLIELMDDLASIRDVRAREIVKKDATMLFDVIAPL